MSIDSFVRPHSRINRLLKFGHRCHLRGARVATFICDALTRILFSADIPCRIPIPSSVTFMHNGLGTVVDGGVVFEGPALIFQHVTLGYAMRPGDGVPRIGSHVIIGAGAGVYGKVHVGDGAFIGANAVVTEDVPAGHVVRSAPTRVTPLPTPEGSRSWWT